MNSLNIIDISEHNGDIDFESAKRKGYHFIIRGGWGREGNGRLDKNFIKNVKSCEQYEIPYGVYWYSYGESPEKVRLEAAFCIKNIKNVVGAHFLYPLYYDIEESYQRGNAQLLANTFCAYVEAQGCYAGVYASLDWWANTSLKSVRLYDRWIAAWHNRDKGQSGCGLWQWTDSFNADVPGLTKCDCNVLYTDYPRIIFEKKLNWLDRENTPLHSVDTMAINAINGLYGNGDDRRNRLGTAYIAVQNRVNEYYDVVNQVIRGDYGNGDDRKRRLANAGYDYSTVQKLVNEKLLKKLGEKLLKK